MLCARARAPFSISTDLFLSYTNLDFSITVFPRAPLAIQSKNTKRSTSQSAIGLISNGAWYMRYTLRCAAYTSQSDSRIPIAPPGMHIVRSMHFVRHEVEPLGSIERCTWISRRCYSFLREVPKYIKVGWYIIAIPVLHSCCYNEN